MAYDLKSVFYLDTDVTITAATAGAGSGQLDLSAYIDPIARGRQKGTGLAVYKTYYSIINSEDANEAAPEPSETGVMSYGLNAGAGFGDVATGGLNFAAGSTLHNASNALLVSGGVFYGAASAATSTPIGMEYIMPSKDVPYVIVRDNVCLTYTVSDSQKFESNATLSARLECAIITLDQATLNQLLRTQTV